MGAATGLGFGLGNGDAAGDDAAEGDGVGLDFAGALAEALGVGEWMDAAGAEDVGDAVDVT